MLGEHAAERGHAGFGLTVRGFAFSAREFLTTHRHAGVVGLDIENGGITGLGRAFLALPVCGGGSDPQHFALDLALSHGNASDLLEMEGGFLVACFIGAFQADEAGKRGGVGTLQSEGGVGGMASLLFPRMVIVVAPQHGASKNPLDFQRVAALADFSGLGFVGSVDLVGGFLEELADELGCGFENGGAQQFFKVGHEGSAGLGGAEGGYEFFDFFFLGEGVAGDVWRFF